MAWERRRWCWKSSPVGPPSFRWRGKREVVGGAGAGTEVGGGRDRRRRAGGVYLSVSVVVMVVSLAPAHPRPLPARAPALIGLKPGGRAVGLGWWVNRGDSLGWWLSEGRRGGLGDLQTTPCPLFSSLS